MTVAKDVMIGEDAVFVGVPVGFVVWWNKLGRAQGHVSGRSRD